jgi:hypothetical protein
MSIFSMMRSLFASCALLLALSLPLQASTLDKWYAGVQLGPEFLTSHTDADWDNSMAFGVYGGFKIDRHLSFEGSVTIASHDGTRDSELDVTSVLFGPRISTYVKRNVEVYADAGIGIDFLDFTFGSYDNTDTKAGLYLGAGIAFPIKGETKLGLDLKYQTLFSDEQPINSDIITVLVRFGF